MALRRRRKREDELAELVRGELTAIRDEVHSSLADTAATLSARLRVEVDQRVGEPSALAAGIRSMRESLATRDHELTTAIRLVAEACDALNERVQIDLLERSALVDAITRLTNTLAVTEAVSRPVSSTPAHTGVIGGTVDPGPRTPAEAIPAPAHPDLAVGDDEIDLRGVDREGERRGAARVPEPAPPRPVGRPVRPDGVEVRCRFGDRWVTGFEVCEVIRVEDVTRYRLRRRSDGSVIPTLFDEKDLRFFTTTFLEPT